jgi:Spy/CpxP family protein refolding chaperone
MQLLRLASYDDDIEQNKPRKSNMKLKNLSFLAGAVALTISAIPFAAQADISSSSPTIVAQSRKQGGWKNKLNLTEAQKAQMQQIKESARADMQKILTPEQLQKLEAAKASGEKKRGVWRSLNLTDAQKAEMKKIKESKKAQFEAILTDEQKAIMQEMKQMRQNRRGNRQQRFS